MQKKRISWLINRQNIDGSWPRDVFLRIPPPTIIDPNVVKKWQGNQIGSGVILEDKERVFT